MSAASDFRVRPGRRPMGRTLFWQVVAGPQCRLILFREVRTRAVARRLAAALNAAIRAVPDEARWTDDITEPRLALLAQGRWKPTRAFLARRAADQLTDAGRATDDSPRRAFGETP